MSQQLVFWLIVRSKPHHLEAWKHNRMEQVEIAHIGQCCWQTLLAKGRTKPPGELPAGRRDDDKLGIFLHRSRNNRVQLYKYYRGTGQLPGLFSEIRIRTPG